MVFFLLLIRFYSSVDMCVFISFSLSWYFSYFSVLSMFVSLVGAVFFYIILNFHLTFNVRRLAQLLRGGCHRNRRNLVRFYFNVDIF